MPAYTTPGDFVTKTKTLIQDVDGVRYTADQYYEALNAGLAEAFRLRPDFFRATSFAVPFYTSADASGNIVWPPEYGHALVIFMVGYLEAADKEGNEDARAVALMNGFITKLTAPTGKGS